MDDKFPRKILIEDVDGGVISAVLFYVDQVASNEPVCIYRYKEYYHSIESARKEEFGDE